MIGSDFGGLALVYFTLAVISAFAVKRGQRHAQR